MKIPLEKIGQILRNKRRGLKLRIDDVADENISRSTISNAERGLPNVTEAMYIYYAEKLGMKNSLLGIVSQAEQVELEAGEQLKELENVIAIDSDGSLQKLEEILTTYQITKRDSLYPFYTYLLGRCAFEQKAWQKAKTFFHEAVELINQKEELTITNLKTACLNELGRIVFFENQLEDALQYTQEGLAFFNAKGERARYQFHLLLNKAIYLTKMKQPEKALEAIEALEAAINTLPSMKILLSTVTLEIIIEMYNTYAIILNELQLHEKALDYAHQGLEIAQKNKYSDPVLTLRTTVGIIYAKIGKPQKAEKCFLMALDLKKRTKREYLLVFAYIELSQLYLKQANWDKAEQILRGAISISERNHDMIHLIECLTALGDCSVQQGQFKKAIPLYQKAEELIKPSKNDEKKCEIATSLGYCYRKLGDQKAFEKYRNKVFEVDTEMKWRDLK